MYKTELECKKINLARMKAGITMVENTNNWDLIPNTNIRDVHLSMLPLRSGQPLLLRMQTNALLFVKEGSILMEIDTNHYDVQAGQLALMPFDAQVICHLPHAQQATIYKMDLFIETQDTDLFVRFDLAADNHVVSLSDPEAFAALCAEAMENNNLSENAFSVFRSAAVMQMAAVYLNERMSAENMSPPFLPVVTYMQEHLGEPLSISKLSQIACMSSEYFIRRFRQAFACPPIKFYDKLRIKKATQLLLFTDKSIREIGSEIGLHDAPHFTRFFRNACGLTPSEYRARFLSDAHPEDPQPVSGDKPAGLSIDVVPGNVYLQHAHVFWLEDKIFQCDVLLRPIDGSFAFLTDMGKLYIVRKNQIALLPAGRRVRYTLTNAQNLSYYRVDFEITTGGENIFTHFNLTDEPLVVDLPNASLMDETCFLAMHNEAMHFDIAYHLSRTACMAKIAALYTHARETAAVPCRDRLIESASLYMKAHTDGSATVSDIAEHFDIEPSYFIRKFKKAFGCTPKKHYDKLRAEAAADMLLHTEQTPRTIGKKVGFTSLKYFNSFFLERIGVTPEEYRRLYNILRRTDNPSSNDELLP